MTPAELAAVIIPLLPTLERWFKEAWSRTDEFEMAWGFLSVLIPERARPSVEVAMRAVWDLYDSGELERAWQDLRGRLDDGGAIERAHDVSLEEATKRQHQRADELDQADAPSPAGEQLFEPLPDPWARGGEGNVR